MCNSFLTASSLTETRGKIKELKESFPEVSFHYLRAPKFFGIFESNKFDLKPVRGEEKREKIDE